MATDLFDFDEISRRVLSRHWTERSAEEQAEFVHLFTDVLERTYIGRIEALRGREDRLRGRGGRRSVRHRPLEGR